MKDPLEGVIFETADLLPPEWQAMGAKGPVRMFNPGLLANGDQWLLAYRVVGSDGLRRIAICRLNQSLEVIAGSPLPLSDWFHLQPTADWPEVVRYWFADPRLYRFGTRLFVYWNSGWHEPRNYQFLHELDPVTLHPLGAARELVLAQGARQKLEKNWTLFATDSGETYAVYAIAPHRVLHFSLQGEGNLVFSEAAETPWLPAGYPTSHGGLRGGTPPQRSATGFLSVCHSVHDGPNGYRYAAAAYRFDSHAPFAPTHGPIGWLPLINPFGEERIHGRLNPAVAEVLYPCGAARCGDRWLIAHGINDEHCAITVLADAQIDATLAPVVAGR